MLDQEYLNDIMEKCEASSARLYDRADKVRKRRILFDISLVTFAVSAFAVLLIGSIDTFPFKMSQDISTLITFGSALAVVAQISFDRFIFPDDPARLKDWAFYIGNYVTRVHSELAEPDVNWERVRVLVDQANLNLDAGEREWKDLVETVKTPPARLAPSPATTGRAH